MRSPPAVIAPLSSVCLIDNRISPIIVVVHNYTYAMYTDTPCNPCIPTRIAYVLVIVLTPLRKKIFSLSVDSFSFREGEEEARL